MKAAVDRIMEAYSLMVDLRAEDEAAVRQRVTDYLADLDGDERALSVEGLKFLRAAQMPGH